MNLRLHLNNRTRRANMCVEKKTCRWEKSETFVSTRVAGVVVGCSLVAVKMNACVLHPPADGHSILDFSKWFFLKDKMVL